MRTRISLLVLAVVLALAGCSNKPSSPQNASSDQAAQPSQPASGEQASSGATPATSAAGTQPSTPATNQQEANAAVAPAAVPKPRPIVLPAGTVLRVHLAQQVGSKISREGDSFSATVASAVSDSAGKVVIPDGAEASGTITQAHPAGRFKGGATLALDLNSINIGGRSYRIHTAGVSETSKGKGKRTAAMVGGGAAGGALIGGLAGGGKGAGIGALIGAGAGTAGSAFTGNRDITLPAESSLSFKLTQPLELKSRD